MTQKAFRVIEPDPIGPEGWILAFFLVVILALVVASV